MEAENWPWKRIQHSFWTPSFSDSMLNFRGVSYLSNREIIFQTFLVGAIWVAARVVDELMNELLTQVTFYLNAFQMLEEVPGMGCLWCSARFRHHNDCNCLSGAREGKLKRRPLVVGNAVDNKIICSAPRSNKNSPKSHPDPKKTGFFCSDELVSSVLVVSDFFYSFFISIAGGKRCLHSTRLTIRFRWRGTGARWEQSARSASDILRESSTILLEYVFYTTQQPRQQQQLPELPLPWAGACRSHRRWSGCLYIYPDQLPRSPGAWRRVDRREKTSRCGFASWEDDDQGDCWHENTTLGV